MAEEESNYDSVVRQLKKNYDSELGEIPSEEKIAEIVLDREIKELYMPVKSLLSEKIIREKGRLSGIIHAESQFFGSSQYMDKKRSSWEKEQEEIYRIVERCGSLMKQIDQR